MKYQEVSYGQDAPFECYLLVQEQNCPLYAFELLDTLDIEEALPKALEQLYDGYSINVETWQDMGGSNWASVITDNRPTDSVVVWSSRNFYVE
jgi:hypothetical protein